MEFQTTATLRAGSRAFYSYTGSAPSNATCLAIATAISGLFSSHLAPEMSTNFDMINVEVLDLSTDTGGFGEDSAVVAGTRSGNAVSIDNAAVLNFEIARRYRGGKPKIFLPFGVEGDTSNNNNTWLSAFVAELEGAWSSFDTGVLAIVESGTTLSEHVNVSYYQGFTSAQNPVTKRWRNIPTPRAVPLVDVITGHTLQEICGVQRRRRSSTTQ